MKPRIKSFLITSLVVVAILAAVAALAIAAPTGQEAPADPTATPGPAPAPAAASAVVDYGSASGGLLRHGGPTRLQGLGEFQLRGEWTGAGEAEIALSGLPTTGVRYALQITPPSRSTTFTLPEGQGRIRADGIAPIGSVSSMTITIAAAPGESWTLRLHDQPTP